MKAKDRLCECGRKIAYVTTKGKHKKMTNDGHHLCRQCWNTVRDKNRSSEEKQEDILSEV